MRHFPATRSTVRLAGLDLDHSRAPARFNPALLGAFFYAAGFFTGAILSGELLLACFLK